MLICKSKERGGKKTNKDQEVVNNGVYESHLHGIFMLASKCYRSLSVCNIIVLQVCTLPVHSFKLLGWDLHFKTKVI